MQTNEREKYFTEFDFFLINLLSAGQFHKKCGG